MRNRGLDVLRGCAVLLVMVTHTLIVIPSLPHLAGAAGAVYWRLKGLGWTGVDLFFVLSGFLIGGLLFKELEREGRIRIGRFWARRAFKILPSYVLLLTVLAATRATPWFDTAHALRSLAIHGLFLQNYFAQEVNGPTWTLAVEEHFYLVIPLALSLCGAAILSREGRGRRRFAIGVGVVASVVFSLRCLRLAGGLENDDFMFSYLRCDGLLVGVFCQWLVRTGSPVPDRLRRRPLFALAAAAVLIAPSLWLKGGHPAMFTIGFSALAVGYGIVVLVATGESSGWHDNLAGRACAAVGRWSYNIYLWHYFLVPLGLPGYVALQAWIAGHVPYAAVAATVQMLIYGAISIAIGGLMTIVFENPILALRERIAWLRAAPSIAPPPPAVNVAA